MRLSELAKILDLRLQGEDATFTGLNTLEAADSGQISFLANPKYAHLLEKTNALAVIVDEAHAPKVRCALVSKNPYYDFARTASFFTHKHSNFTGVSELAFVHSTAELGQGCVVHPFAYVSEGAKIGAGTVLYPHSFVGLNATIGDNCTVYPSAVIMATVKVGNNCTIQPGAVLGTDGFGFARVGGQMQKVPQIGTVVLQDGAEIGANSCVDRATLSATVIGKDTKLDNLVQIGHNVTTGEQCLIIAQVGIAGSTSLGNRVTLAGQAGVAGHLHINDDVTVGPQAGIAKDIPAGVTGSGTPFMDHSTFLRMCLTLPKIPTMHKKIQDLERELSSIKQLLESNTLKEKE